MGGRVIEIPGRRSFTPETNEAMALAFDTACGRLGSAVAPPRDAGMARSRMAAAILRLAERGEVDPERLSAGALDAVMEG